MPRQIPLPDPDGENAADRLALALEDVGFDVGRAFPGIHGGLDGAGAPVVELGRVTAGVAVCLADLLSQAARSGIALPEA